MLLHHIATQHQQCLHPSAHLQCNMMPAHLQTRHHHAHELGQHQQPQQVQVRLSSAMYLCGKLHALQLLRACAAASSNM
jgi:hypothetical protein